MPSISRKKSEKKRIDPADRDSYPLRASAAGKERWANYLTRRFAGQIDVDGLHMSDEPRPARLGGSLTWPATYHNQLWCELRPTSWSKARSTQQLQRRQRIKTIQFESGSDKDDDNNEISECSGVDEGSQNHSSGSHEEPEAGKRKKKGKVKGKGRGSKGSRGGRGGRRGRGSGSGEGGGAGGFGSTVPIVE